MMLSGIFATPTLRNCSGPPSEAHTPAGRAPAFGGAPSELADGPLRASRAFAGRVAPPRLRRRLRGDSGAVSGHGKAPAGAGAFGSAFEVLQDVCQVCGVVAAELFEEVDFDVHWGFLSLFPLCCTSILSTAAPRVKPQRCVLHHIFGHRKLPKRRTQGFSFQLRRRSLRRRSLTVRNCNLPARNLTTGYVTTTHL